MLSTKLKEAAGNSADATLYVDDVFSTYLYTGNGSTQTITNGIDLAGKGGLVWTKSRSAATDHKLTDTVRGATKALISSTTAAETTDTTGLTAFNSTGFSLGASSVYNTNAATYVSWTFRKAAKFFDVVTYTGNGVAGRQIAHSLGVAPGMIIVKRTSSGANWPVYHRSTGNTKYLILNATFPADNDVDYWYSTTPTSTDFTVNSYSDVNASGSTYVAYLFAHDTSSTGFIQCGSYTGTGVAGLAVNLGWEPQFLLVKKSSSTSDWFIFDVMRGMPVGGSDYILFPNSTSEESNYNYLCPTATGFTIESTFGLNDSGSTYIYMAIRRPNKPPTTGSQVYNAIARTGTGAAATVTGVGFPSDLVFIRNINGALGQSAIFTDRLRGANRFISSGVTSAESNVANVFTGLDSEDGYYLGSDSGGHGTNYNAMPFINWSFKRAPGFFDVVCYTGTGANTTQAHNLGVVPELIIVKARTDVTNWPVYSAAVGNTKVMYLNDTGAPLTVATCWNSTTPTASVFSLGTFSVVNTSGITYVAYLFASCPGVSKVGSYTGNGTTQTINCGFTGGARFVLIKRTDSTGDWYVWDTARGIVAANDPHLSLNTTAAEVTTDDSIDPYATGFAVNQVAATNINVSSATYVYLSIA